MTVEKLEHEMSADELDDWIQFYNMEPFGDEERMSDKRNALSCAISANSMGGEYKQSDFEFYKDYSKSETKIDIEDITDEEKKKIQSAIFQMLTAQ